MNYSQNYCTPVLLVCAGLALLACYTVTPHENFKNTMSFNVGKKIDSPKVNWVREEYFTDSVVLPNGNIENKYRWRGTCRYFYEIDSKTKTIVGWRFEGTEHDCAIPP